MKKVILFVAVFWMGIANAQTLKVSVNGMVCAFCVQGIERNVGGLPGVKKIKVDLDSHLVTIESKDGEKVDAETVKKAIADSGFNVTKIEEK
ncbi:MAG: heavy-metal-associated domain-containing protein [Bdellovibrionales bacterium]|nr:heavy-metal-associated domain-containing protein [Bdellovibrionales bacterium]